MVSFSKMKLITRNTDYAIRALCFMAKNKGKMTPVSVLVKELKVPRPFLRKILQILERRGMLISARGIGGGFALAKGPEKISVLELVEIFQGPFELTECLLKKKRCPEIERCRLRKKICCIEKNFISELKAITMESILR